MRLLFRLISFVVFVLTVYFLLNLNHSSEKQKHQDWVIIKNQSGMELAFPTKPMQLTTHKTYPQLGSSQLSSFQSAQDQALFALLIVKDSEVDLSKQSLDALKDSIHQINDTQGLKIEAVRHFRYQSFPALEYQATHADGVTSWCRTIHTGKALLSVIYAHQANRFDRHQRDRYFQSLRF